jgi:hypothetical protein
MDHDPGPIWRLIRYSGELCPSPRGRRPHGGGNRPVYVRSRTDLYDEHGREAGGWRVVAALTSTVRFAGLLLDHRTYLEPGERVVGMEPWTALAQPLNPCWGSGVQRVCCQLNPKEDRHESNRSALSVIRSR